jgi:hypothetical protein
MPASQKLADIQKSIEVYEEVIRSFENARELLIRRQRNAVDGVAVHIQRSLELNQRTLESLNRALDTAKGQIAREGSKLSE